MRIWGEKTKTALQLTLKIQNAIFFKIVFYVKVLPLCTLNIKYGKLPCTALAFSVCVSLQKNIRNLISR